MIDGLRPPGPIATYEVYMTFRSREAARGIGSERCCRFAAFDIAVRSQGGAWEEGSGDYAGTGRTLLATAREGTRLPVSTAVVGRER